MSLYSSYPTIRPKRSGARCYPEAGSTLALQRTRPLVPICHRRFRILYGHVFQNILPYSRLGPSRHRLRRGRTLPGLGIIARTVEGGIVVDRSSYPGQYPCHSMLLRRTCTDDSSCGPDSFYFWRPSAMVLAPRDGVIDLPIKGFN